MDRQKRKKQLTTRVIIFLAVIAVAVWALVLVIKLPRHTAGDNGVAVTSSSSGTDETQNSSSSNTGNSVSDASEETEANNPAPPDSGVTPSPSPASEPDSISADDLTFTDDELSTLPWNLVLVSREHPIPEDYEIPEITYFDDGQPLTQGVDSRAYDALTEMKAAAAEEGYYPYVSSSFREWDLQNYFYQENVQNNLAAGMTQEEAENEAAKWVQPPGCSEHQLGLACDIVDPDYTDLDDGQLDTGTQQWLMEHCWEYGFVLRYPADKIDITGVSSEPWHYRYVGKDAAKEMKEKDLCLEEYLAQILH